MAASIAWRSLAPFSTTRAGFGMPPTRPAPLLPTCRNTGAPAPISGPVSHFGMLCALRNHAKWGDGWMPLAYPPGEAARQASATLPRYAEEAGRDPATIGIDTRVSAGAGAEAREQVRFWKSIGGSV
jgi:hypothetical protein